MQEGSCNARSFTHEIEGDPCEAQEGLSCAVGVRHGMNYHSPLVDRGPNHRLGDALFCLAAGPDSAPGWLADGRSSGNATADEGYSPD